MRKVFASMVVTVTTVTIAGIMAASAASLAISLAGLKSDYQNLQLNRNAAIDRRGIFFRLVPGSNHLN